MFITTDLARAAHVERHGRLLAAADARRLRRQHTPARTTRREGDRRGRFLKPLRRRSSHRDAKIDRLRASWLAPDRRAAHRLARVADLVDARAGTVLVPGRFTYIALDENHAGLVVTDGTPSVTLTSDAALLVLDTGSFQEMRRSIPMLNDALASRHGTLVRHDTRPTGRARPLRANSQRWEPCPR